MLEWLLVYRSGGWCPSYPPREVPAYKDGRVSVSFEHPDVRTLFQRRACRKVRADILQAASDPGVIGDS